MTQQNSPLRNKQKYDQTIEKDNSSEIMTLKKNEKLQRWDYQSTGDADPDFNKKTGSDIEEKYERETLKPKKKQLLDGKKKSSGLKLHKSRKKFKEIADQSLTLSGQVDLNSQNTNTVFNNQKIRDM